MSKKKSKAAVRYYTYAHNIEMRLQNGSFVRQYPDGKIVQYINGDCMGLIDSIPNEMIEVPEKQAVELLPRCCR